MILGNMLSQVKSFFQVVEQDSATDASLKFNILASGLQHMDVFVLNWAFCDVTCSPTCS